MTRSQQLIIWINQALTLLERGNWSDLQRSNLYISLGFWMRELREVR